MGPSDKKSSFLAMEVDPVTSTYSKFWKWADQILYDTLVTRTIRYPFTDRGGISQIDKSFW